MTAEAATGENAANASAKVTVTKDTANGTDYVVLEQDASKFWREFARETARSDSAAIKQALDGNTDGGTFVAIPARSFKPVKVTPETKTTLKLEEAR